MNPRTVRTVRTVLQVLLAVASAVPTVVAGLPAFAAGAQLVVVAGALTHWFHLIESLPFFPAALRVDDAAGKSLP